MSTVHFHRWKKWEAVQIYEKYVKADCLRPWGTMDEAARETFKLGLHSPGQGGIAQPQIASSKSAGDSECGALANALVVEGECSTVAEAPDDASKHLQNYLTVRLSARNQLCLEMPAFHDVAQLPDEDPKTDFE